MPPLTQLNIPFPRKGDHFVYGSPMLPPHKFEVVGECWIWLGATITSRSGLHYGSCYFEGKTDLVHRVMFRTHHGEIKDGYDIPHTCFETLCGNPAHLEQHPATTNRLKMTRKRKEQCAN